MAMKRHNFPAGECQVFTANLCQRTAGERGASYVDHESCKGIMSSRELGVPGPAQTVFCICHCHKKPAQT